MIRLESAIAKTRNGDVEAFGVVIKACQAYVRSFVSCFVPDENDVNDLAQETFVFAYENLDEYMPGTNFRAWLKAIARNKVMTFNRRGRQKHESRRQYAVERLVQRTVNLTPSFAEERVNALSCCIEQLPEEQRTFLTSALGRGCTLDEWAARTNLASDVVRKRISRLYVALRHCIEHRLSEGAKA